MDRPNANTFKCVIILEMATRVRPVSPLSPGKRLLVLDFLCVKITTMDAATGKAALWM